MALIRTGPVVADISGKVGAVTFAQTKNGTILRSNGIHVKATSARTLLRESHYALARNGWNAKDEAQRQNWITAATQVKYPNRFGEPHNLSGFQFFMKIALLLAATNDFPTLEPPQMLPTVPLLNPGLSIVIGGTYQWTFDNPGGLSGMAGFTYAARPFTTSPTTSSRYWKFIERGVIGFGNPQIFQDSFNEQMGTPLVGERIGIRFMIKNPFTLPGHLYELWTFAV